MIHQARDAGAALALAGRARPHVLLTALHLPGSVDGFGLLQALRRGGMDLEAIVWTPVPGLEALSTARRLEVLKVIGGPLDAEAVERSVSDALRIRRLRLEASRRSPPPTEAEDRARLVGHSEAMLEVLSQIADCGASDASVLILGESGSGKELVARGIHRCSRRSGEPFEPVRLSRVVPTLVQSTLFGHVKGAFTDAKRDHRGCFERVGSGTIFLDEIGDLPLEAQASLLAVLQERTFTRVGGERLLATDARVIAATQRDLRRGVEEAWFREDLFYRLNVVVIRVPPLRDRMDDLEELVAHLLARAGVKHGSNTCPILAPEALERLRQHSWLLAWQRPGTRELPPGGGRVGSAGGHPCERSGDRPVPCAHGGAGLHAGRRSARGNASPGDGAQSRSSPGRSSAPALARRRRPAPDAGRAQPSPYRRRPSVGRGERV